MLKRDLMRLAGTILLGGVAMLVALPACGGSGAVEPLASATSSPTVKATATAAVTATAPSRTPLPVTPTVTPTSGVATPPAISPTPGSSSPSDAQVLALGKEVFERKAGGIGCQACHGIDAKGQIGPNIRGASADDIRKALTEVDMMMQAVKNLNAQDIEAVAAYLKYLATQP